MKYKTLVPDLDDVRMWGHGKWMGFGFGDGYGLGKCYDTLPNYWCKYFNGDGEGRGDFPDYGFGMDIGFTIFDGKDGGGYSNAYMGPDCIYKRHNSKTCDGGRSGITLTGLHRSKREIDAGEFDYGDFYKHDGGYFFIDYCMTKNVKVPTVISRDAYMHDIERDLV